MDGARKEVRKRSRMRKRRFAGAVEAKCSDCGAAQEAMGLRQGTGAAIRAARPCRAEAIGAFLSGAMMLAVAQAAGVCRLRLGRNKRQSHPAEEQDKQQAGGGATHETQILPRHNWL